ncbi:MAG: F0F1 ATP synthase subunit delta [Gammaproteobacteria bacterium]|nr:F0F1 ATP synthase subunit delta [Gammaproteobacteria bacterium]
MSDNSTVARPYAQAIFELASADKSLSEWSEALGVAANVLGDEGAQSFLAQPGLDDSGRAEFVISVCGEAAGPGVLSGEHGQNLLRLLAENGRLTALSDIAAQFDALKAKAENRVNVQLTTAAAVDKKVAAGISKALEQKLGRQVELTLVVDEALLGGAVIRAQDMVIDGSVKNRLEKLAATLSA